MRWLYLHGFASGRDSAKGTWLARHFARQGIALERLDLRLPSFAHLRPAAMIAHVRAQMGERAVLMGSSLGAMVAARVAEADPRVEALVLLAPAFGLAERWRAAQPDAVRRWEEEGFMEVDDHTTGGRGRVDWGFWLDAAAVEAGGPPDVRVPTLLLHGTQDTVVGIGPSRAWAASRPNVEMIEVPDGHELIVSLPRIARETDRWRAGLPSRP